MARFLKLGTPDRTKSYVFSAVAGRGVLLWSLAAATLLVGGFFVFNSVGMTRVASPGPLASAHANLDTTCEGCHAHPGASDFRCERCHDPAGLEMWRVAPHVGFGREVAGFAPASDSAAKAEAGRDLGCAGCHGDHRGRAFRLTVVDDRECVACHRVDTPSLKRHVEFAVVRAKETPIRGIKISHARHVREALARLMNKNSVKELTEEEKQKGQTGSWLQRTCETCHVATANLVSYEPIVFESHCASCHVVDGSLGSTGSIPSKDVVPIDQIKTSWAASAKGALSEEGETVSKTVVAHADPWILFNLAKIRREIDPAGYLSDRLALVRDLDSSAQVTGSFSLTEASDGDLAIRARELDGEITALTAPVGSGTGGGDQGTDLDWLRSSAAKYRSALETAVAGGLIDPAGAAATREALERTSAPASAGAMAPLEPAEAAALRAELLAVLDSLQARAVATGDAVLGRRADELRRRLSAWRSGSSGSGDLKARLQALRGERERLGDEIDYRRHMPAGTRKIVPRKADRRVLEIRSAEARRRLEASLAIEILPAPALEPSERETRLRSAEALSFPCKKCHEITGPALAPVSIDVPIFPRSIFDHGPHVRVRDCGFCHAEGGNGVLASKSARDVIVPGVANCRTCHRPSDSRADCATCHRFHPSGYPSQPPAQRLSTALIAEASHAAGPLARPSP